MSKRFSEGLYPWAPLDGQASTPATPAAGTYRVYVTDAGDLALVDDAGEVVTFLTEAPTPTTVAINSQASNYTTVADDAGKVIRATDAADITIPAEASVDYPVGTVIGVRSATVNTVTVVEDTGVTVNIEAGLTLDLRGQYAEVSLHKVGADTWEAVGGFAEDAS